MIKKVLFLTLFILGVNVSASNITKEQCEKNDEEFIFAGNECINYAFFEGDDNEDLIIVVHGTWDEGSNVLGRYAPFAETLNLSTDKSVIAVALPGYSKSSLNELKSIGSKEYNHQAAKKVYIEFLEKLMLSLKDKFKASNLTFVGHSAGAMMGASLVGVNNNLFKNAVFVGGRFERPNYANDSHILAIDVLDKMNKNSKFIMVYGTEDKISKPEVTKNFYKKMKEKGLNVVLIEAKNAVHIDLDMTDESVEAISELFEEE